MDEIKEIMGAKNFTEEQAKNFYRHYQGYIKVNGYMYLYDFLVKTGISPEISPDIMKKLEKNG